MTKTFCQKGVKMKQLLLSVIMGLAMANLCVADDVKWIDGKELPIEGKGFADEALEGHFDRLPKVGADVNANVQNLRHHTAGMQFRFTTTSPFITIRWQPLYDDDVKSLPGCLYDALGMAHMPATAVSGVDVYVQGADGKWKYLKTGFIYVGKNNESTGTIAKLNIAPGTPICINLPLCNGIKTFSLGVAPDATIAPLPPRKNGMVKPVVFYGTSITHGGCASRPGMAFVNIVGRELDVPVVNLGFSGGGQMEFELSDHLAAIDASCYVLDALWNMGQDKVEQRYEPFIRNLRAKRPDVPIIMAEQCDVFCKGPNGKDQFMHKLYDKLIAEGWKNLVYLPKTKMYTGDREGTVDGTHPNDVGMQSLANAFGEAVRAALPQLQ